MILIVETRIEIWKCKDPSIFDVLGNRQQQNPRFYPMSEPHPAHTPTELVILNINNILKILVRYLSWYRKYAFYAVLHNVNSKNVIKTTTNIL